MDLVVRDDQGAHGQGEQHEADVDDPVAGGAGEGTVEVIRVGSGPRPREQQRRDQGRVVHPWDRPGSRTGRRAHVPDATSAGGRPIPTKVQVRRKDRLLRSLRNGLPADVGSHPVRPAFPA